MVAVLEQDVAAVDGQFLAYKVGAQKTRKEPEEKDDEEESLDTADDIPELVGALVRTRNGRPGVVVSHDPTDELLEFKVQFLDELEPSCDWLAAVDVFAQDGSAQLPQSGEQPKEEEVGDLFDIWEDEGIGAKHGLTEIEGGIGIDSCASDNVTARKHLKSMGYKIKPSAGSKTTLALGQASPCPLC